MNERSKACQCPFSALAATGLARRRAGIDLVAAAMYPMADCTPPGKVELDV